MGLWRVHVEVEDRPGQLGELAKAVGAAGCNIVSLTVLGERGPDGSVTDELLVDAADEQAAARLADRIRAAGMGCTLAVPAGGGELRDPVTTALALARRVAADPDAGPRAVAALLHARVLGESEPSGYAYQLPVAGQEIRLGRSWPFTATELARAAVLVELAELCATPFDTAARGGQAGPHELPSLGMVLLGDGSEAELRMITPSDGPLVAALHARCTPNTRRSAFLDPSPSLPQHELRALLVGRSSAGTGVLALTSDGGHGVGLAILDPDGPGAGGSGATLSVLVEDAWQSRGLGTALVRRAVELAGEAGHGELVAATHPGNLRITRLLRRAGLRPSAQLADGLLQVRVTLNQPIIAGR
ncbi:MAG TPA: GNAT family N-acetyltransferase [Pseudonocardia sp.]|uniref:GNAT family N-acetyltransferase n=1 Tax=Pseudonocardia sp. TaxID=60912 RepID=UPI002F3FD8A3